MISRPTSEMAHVLLSIFVLLVVLESIVCPPVKVKKTDEEKEKEEDLGFGLEYERYLKEVVGILESDEMFRKKLQESNVSEIKSGEVARHLEFVSHNIRTKLDEIKRKEIDRLRQVMKLQRKISRGQNREDMPVMNTERVLAHLDHRNPNTFEVEDLAKLIKQASKDLEYIDEQRRSEFKRYEMEKEVEERQKLAKMDEAQKKEEIKRLEEMKKKHAEHPKVHHPISKDQLEEVWEESDGMAKDEFDPRTFFALHDQNGDMVLDEAEVEALFQKELDKVYDPNNPEDDIVERYEEMNRMREHVFNEVDTNGDKLISLDEFLKSTQREDFEKDEGWDTLDERKVYTDEEIEQFVREYEEKQRKELEGQGFPMPLDPSHQAPFVQDHLGQDESLQGQQVHMEQQPIQPVHHQQAANLPPQEVHFESHHQQDLGSEQHVKQQQRQQHFEPPQHIEQHRQEGQHVEPEQHVQHQQEQFLQHPQQAQQQQEQIVQHPQQVQQQQEQIVQHPQQVQQQQEQIVQHPQQVQQQQEQIVQHPQHVQQQQEQIVQHPQQVQQQQEQIVQHPQQHQEHIVQHPQHVQQQQEQIVQHPQQVQQQQEVKIGQ